MRSETFILKSGAKLVVTEGPWEHGVVLMEAVKSATRGKDAGLDIDDVVLANEDVRVKSYPLWDTVLYETVRLTQGLFDDPKLGPRAKSDYFEILLSVIKVNVLPFFLKNASASISYPGQPSESPKSP